MRNYYKTYFSYIIFDNPVFVNISVIHCSQEFTTIYIRRICLNYYKCKKIHMFLSSIVVLASLLIVATFRKVVEQLMPDITAIANREIGLVFISLIRRNLSQ